MIPLPFPSSRLAALIQSRGHGVSSGKLAARAGISRRQLYWMATDPDANPTWASVAAVLAALESTPADLFAPAPGPRRPARRA